MDLLMTSGAVLEARAAQIMQRRWHGANGAIRRGLRPRQVGMALQADELYRRAGQHPRIYRSVRLVTGAAAFQPHWSVFENKGASKVAMAFHAARFIGINETHVTGEVAAVGIVAIHARHGAFGKAMFVGSREARPDIGMAPGALRIDFRRFPRY
jgi:hypothetical protein